MPIVESQRGSESMPSLRYQFFPRATEGFSDSYRRAQEDINLARLNSVYVAYIQLRELCERQEYVEKPISSNRKVGQLETRLLQLEGSGERNKNELGTIPRDGLHEGE